MILHFLMLSAEKEDFVREILIDAEHTFLQLHQAIQVNLNFDQSQLASFFTASSDWMKEEEITLMRMDESQTEIHVMEESKLKDFVNEKGEKLVYVFDMFGNRGAFLEVMNISDTRKLAEPSIIKEEGEIPEQLLLDEVGMEDMEGLFDLNDESLTDGLDEPETLSYDELNEEDYSDLF